MWKNAVRRFAWLAVSCSASLAALPLHAGKAKTLLWDPSRATNVVGYNLYYGLASRDYTTVIYVSAPATEATVELEESETYFLTVTAVTAGGLESDYSDEISTPTGNFVPVTRSDSAQTHGGQPRAITLTASDADGDSLTFSITVPPTNGTLSGSAPNLVYSPNENFFGIDSFKFVAMDGHDESAAATFMISVIASNSQPTLDRLPNLVVNGDDGPVTVSLTGIGSGSRDEAQHLTVTAVSNNPRLIPNPTIHYTSPDTTGTLTFAPISDSPEFPMARITVTVSDAQAEHSTRSRSFLVLVNHANLPPTLDPLADVIVNENAATTLVNLSGISSGANHESQTLSVTAVSSDPGLISHPVIDYTSPNASGQLAFTPVPGASGVATIVVSVSDDQPQRGTFTRSFVVTVIAANRPPVVNAGADQTLAWPGTVSFEATVTDDLWPNGWGLWTAQWTQVSGPAVVTFADSNSVRSEATFPAPGQYTLRLTAFDGIASAFDDVQVSVLAPPPVPISVLDLSIASVNARTAIVNLRTDRPTLCAVEYGLTAEFGRTAEASLAGTNHSVVLTNLEPGTTYFFQVRSSDAGNYGPLTYTLSFNTAPHVLLNWPAEAGTLAEPMAVGADAEALGAQYIWSPDTDQGSADYPVSVPIESQYRMWCRVLTIGEGVGSFSFSVKDSPEFSLRTTASRESGWHWIEIDLATGPPAAPSPSDGKLSRGTHQFVLRARQPGLFLDQIVFSNDPEWRP